MKNFAVIQSLVGKDLRKEELKNTDCYVSKNLGLFIPCVGTCGYAQRKNHTHPSYMITILFSLDEAGIKPDIEIDDKHYPAVIYSPNIVHNDVSDDFIHYYCIMINKDYFEEQFSLYTDIKPNFAGKQFAVCSDMLRALNIFAFEYSKSQPNSDITLDAQATIISHWIIRSVLGENLDMRAVSQNYSIARVQNYIEQHYNEKITVKILAELVNMSVSSFSRLFKRELNISPIEYLIEVRIEKSKILLRRKEVTITEISMRCGFSGSAHYTTSFKRIQGITPSEYRELYIK